VKTEVKVSQGGGYISLIIIVILLLAGGFFYTKYRSVKEDNVTLKQTKQTLLAKGALLENSVFYYKARNGQLATSVDRLTLTNKELKTYKSDLANEIRNMKIKQRNVLSVDQTGSVTTISTPFVQHKDSVITYENKPTPVKIYPWSDAWTNLKCTVVADSIGSMSYAGRDTITSVGERVRKKFWFIRYGTKGVMQKVTNKNKNTNITYNEYIQLE
jgi:hypothetical protein